MRTAFLLLLLLGQEVPPHPDKLDYKPLRYEVPDAAAMRTELSSGTPAYLLEDPSLPMVDIHIFVKGGSFGEPRGKEGIASLTASLMRVGGTKGRSPEALDEELEFLAAQLHVLSADVYGSASLSVLSKDLDKGLDLLVDVLKNPLFKQEKLETLKSQTLDRLKARNDSTASIEAREANLLFYGDFPLNRLATKASIESLTREDLVELHKGRFHPSNFIIAAAGAFRKKELLGKLETAFREWPKVNRPAGTIPPVKHEPKPEIYCFNKPVNQGRVTFGHMGIDLHHPDVQAIRVMSYILGAGGFSSRLMQKVRTEEGLAYHVSSDFRPGLVYPWPFKIQFQSKSESCAYAAKLCLDEVARIQKEGVTEKELKDTIQFYLDGFPGLFFATPFQTVTTFAQAELLDYPKDYYQTYREKIARCTVKDVQRVAREHLKPEKFAWVVVGDIEKIRKGDGKHAVTLADLGTPVDVPLPDPLTLDRPGR